MYLSDAVGKLGRYYSASSELVCAARHWACRLFKSIETAVSDPRPYLFVKVTWESTRRDTAACRIAFGLFARALTLLLHRPISLRARFAYLSPGAVRSTAYHKHSTTHLEVNYRFYYSRLATTLMPSLPLLLPSKPSNQCLSASNPT